MSEEVSCSIKNMGMFSLTCRMIRGWSEHSMADTNWLLIKDAWSCCRYPLSFGLNVFLAVLYVQMKAFQFLIGNISRVSKLLLFGSFSVCKNATQGSNLDTFLHKNRRQKEGYTGWPLKIWVVHHEVFELVCVARIKQGQTDMTKSTKMA